MASAANPTAAFTRRQKQQAQKLQQSPTLENRYASFFQLATTNNVSVLREAKKEDTENSVVSKDGNFQPKDDEEEDEFWRKAENPWQFLAACFELRRAALYALHPKDQPSQLQQSSQLQDSIVASIYDGDNNTKNNTFFKEELTEGYACRLAVQQDGSCNGLQHYAALGGDEEGAKRVNLMPSDRPQDVYAAVADLVLTRVTRDAASLNTPAMHSKATGEGEKQNPPDFFPLAPNNSPSSITKGKVVDGNERECAQELLRTSAITRKLIKQTVMTKVYGVTAFGARQQIATRLREHFSTLNPNQTTTSGSVGVDAMAKYVAKAVMEAMRGMFRRAQDIQDWLGLIAKEIGASVHIPKEHLDKLKNHLHGIHLFFDEEEKGEFAWHEGYVKDPHGMLVKLAHNLNQSKSFLAYPQTVLVWQTPVIGFCVVPPYVKAPVQLLHTCLQRINLGGSSCTAYDDASGDETLLAERGFTVDARKQASAFPPNYIHSLDATHMFMTALACHKQLDRSKHPNPLEDNDVDNGGGHGVTFASVHDCFWTHPATVDDMNAILREQFVALYNKQNVLELLTQDLKERYRDYWVPIERRPKKRLNKNDDDDELLSQIDPEIDKKKTKNSEDCLVGWRKVKIPDPPKKGSLDLEQVKNSEYFFS